MSEEPNTPLALNIYEEALNEDTTCDLSSQGLAELPELTNRYLSALYLQNNALTILPSDIFTTLKYLKYLDLRDNQLTDIPASIKLHRHLSHLLLQNNKLTTLPNEMGTVPNLKVLQLGGNPLMHPPREIINAGVSSVKKFLNEHFIDQMFANDASSDVTGDSVSTNGFYPEHFSQDGRSYNSVLDEAKLKKAMRVRVNERDSDDSDEELYAKLKGKCPEISKESEYYTYALSKFQKLELLKNWRSDYRMGKFAKNGSYKIDSNNYPYDTNPDCMSMLNRDELEKDLPDKYKKKLVRRSKPTVPRKSNNDVHLALKIKQLFDNLEAIELNRKDMTPRTEQKMLMNEIQKDFPGPSALRPSGDVSCPLPLQSADFASYVDILLGRLPAK
ncbi:unnamed protein product [Spodoptera littoralis]|uniref:Uncharacterized protein n=1 Tax=Spodoptera littoralis TaxID=7109 RepID=A0A9P0I7I6_SPOLI|nr:unnamed protein product [Spodoptera littoralis]CAH1641600.1 unnamed protein product [Spodoptera littoralis]